MAVNLTIQKRTRPYTRPPLMTPIFSGAVLRERLGLPRYRTHVQKATKPFKTDKVTDKHPIEDKPVIPPAASPTDSPSLPPVTQNRPAQEPPKPQAPNQERPERSSPRPSWQRPQENRPTFNRPIYQSPRQNQQLPPRRQTPPAPTEKKTPTEPAERQRPPVDIDTQPQAEKQPPLLQLPPVAVPPPVSSVTTPPSQSPQQLVSQTPPVTPSPAPTPKLPTLGRLLARHKDLPPQTAILGICEDQLPMLLDLYDPAPGALLIVGDERQLQLDLLRTAIASVALRNSPRGVQFIVFSHLPDAWQSWVNEQNYGRYCLGVFGVDDPQAKEWMMRLADWAEQRRTGQRGGPPIVMLLDTLSFLPRLDYDLRLNFEWLVKEGSQAGIWTITAISTALANTLTRQINNIFQTFIFGYTEDTPFYVRTAGLSEAEAKSFGASGQFAVKVATEEGETWLKFRLPS